ncbi:MAG TPA: hypothetical protein DEA47_03755 [Peptococcaceae bacterium]|nr:MAG: hypothetical protein XD50_0918 [Clostridia bacterium 41_269]HBT20466.1 hypothetical protein [Peptococcaceae bacterium]
MFYPSVIMTSNASGAYNAAKEGFIVAVVDVIDMSTSAEAVLEMGAVEIYGASPAGFKVPVPINPEGVGFAAGKTALEKETGIIIISEPRVGTDEERKRRCEPVIQGIKKAGAEILGIVPNLGAEITKLADFKGMVVVAVTDSGGTAFDAAFNAGARVLTATVARVPGKKGKETAAAGVKRICEEAKRHRKNIAVVAASSNALEDLLAAQYIYNLILEEGFLSSV